jgi:hypothetical protein
MYRERFEGVVWSLAMAIALAGGAAALGAPAVDDRASEQERLTAQHGMRIEVETTPAQDPVVFTDLAPFVTDDPPVRLPPDQDLE